MSKTIFKEGIDNSIVIDDAPEHIVSNFNNALITRNYYGGIPIALNVPSPYRQEIIDRYNSYKNFELFINEVESFLNKNIKSNEVSMGTMDETNKLYKKINDLKVILL